MAMTQAMAEHQEVPSIELETECRRVLRGWVHERYHSAADFARARCDYRVDWVSNRLNGRTRITLDDAEYLANRLGHDVVELIQRARGVTLRTEPFNLHVVPELHGQLDLPFVDAAQTIGVPRLYSCP